jgi:hypothetical protein
MDNYDFLLIVGITKSNNLTNWLGLVVSSSLAEQWVVRSNPARIWGMVVFI